MTDTAFAPTDGDTDPHTSAGPAPAADDAPSTRAPEALSLSRAAMMSSTS